MNLQLDLEPLSIKVSSYAGYGISLLGYGYNNVHRAIGFNFYNERTPTGKNWMLVIFIYGFIRRKVLRHIPDDYQMVCTHCGNPVWKNNLYCPTCTEYVDCEGEVTRVPPLK